MISAGIFLRRMVPIRTYSTKSKYMFDVKAETFESEVLQASHKTPVIVDVWAEWCRPCRMLAPVLEEAVSGQEGKVLLAKMNADETQVIPGVTHLPTVVGFSKGKEVSKFVGGHPSGFVKQFVEDLIAQHNKQ